MTTLEIALWSCMAGGMLTISLASLGDALLSRSRGAFMGLSFVAVLTLYAVLLSGLLHHAFPEIPQRLVQILQVGLGPLCCALALVYTGRWLHTNTEDAWICPVMRWGMALMLLAATALSAAAALADVSTLAWLLALSAVTCFVTVGLTSFCAWRAYLLGDRLAIWVLPTAVALSLTLYGLYTQAAAPGSLPIPMVILTAFSTVAYLLMVAALSIVRTRQARRLERLAGLHIGSDPTTGLPTGSALVAKVDDCFWRSARAGMACNVVCLHLHNLYELADIAGHGVENQIALAMSARIRRAVGFRCVVGLYHPRCFVAVIQVHRESSESQIANFVQRLRYLISKPVTITGHQHAQHEFRPDWGIGIVSAAADSKDGSTVLRQAERLAMQDGVTAPSPLAAPAH